jgi:hypothetical protein
MRMRGGCSGKGKGKAEGEDENERKPPALIPVVLAKTR